MSSSISSFSPGYLLYYIMGPGVSSISIYFVDSNNKTHPAVAISNDPSVIYYFDQSNAAYTATTFKIDVNGTNILTVSLPNIQKTATLTLVVQLSISYSSSLPYWLVQSVAGVLTGVKVSLNMVPCLVYTTTCPSGTSSPQTACGSLGNPSASGFTGTISVSVGYQCSVNVVQVVLKSNTYSLNGVPLQIILYFQSYSSSQCTNSSGCKFTVNIYFTT